MRLRGAPPFGGPEKAVCYVRLSVKHILCVNSYIAQCALSVQDCEKVRHLHLLLIRPHKSLNPTPLVRFCSAMYEESRSPPVPSCRTLLPQDLPVPQRNLVPRPVSAPMTVRYSNPDPKLLRHGSFMFLSLCNHQSFSKFL
jgi:hypothetical protein